MKASVLALSLIGLLCGCVAYRAPNLVFQRGPETNYNQERSGVQSRSTTAEQQVAESTQAQDQTTNSTDATMPTAMDAVKTVGLRQGVAATQTPTQGREQATGTVTGTEQTPTGQSGGQAIAPVIPISGGGDANVTNPTNQATGQGSNPGALTGGTTTTGSASATTAPTTETLYAQSAVRNADGTVTVQASDGQAYTGTVTGPFQQPDGSSDFVLLQASGEPVKVRAAGDRAAALSGGQ